MDRGRGKNSGKRGRGEIEARGEGEGGRERERGLAASGQYPWIIAPSVTGLFVGLGAA